MLRAACCVSLILLVTACAGTATGVAEPEIKIVQASVVSPAATHVTGGVPVEYAMTVKNTSDQPITLKRVDLITQGYGAYTLQPTSKPFDVMIPPGTSQVLQIMAAADIDVASMVGANGPVTVRATVQFDSPKGAFRTVVVQQVHANAGLGS